MRNYARTHSRFYLLKNFSQEIGYFDKKINKFSNFKKFESDTLSVV